MFYKKVVGCSLVALATDAKPDGGEVEHPRCKRFVRSWLFVRLLRAPCVFIIRNALT